MYKFAYAEILDESASVGRARERLALDHVVDLLERAEADGPDASERPFALLAAQKLWSVLVGDLAEPGNALPQALKADLASLGLWVIKETDRLLDDRARSLSALIEVNRTIMDGLK